MATTSNDTFTATVTNTGHALVVEIPTEGRGTRRLSLDLARYDAVQEASKIVISEHVVWLLGNTQQGRPARMKMTLAELQGLVDLRKRLDAHVFTQDDPTAPSDEPSNHDMDDGLEAHEGPSSMGSDEPLPPAPPAPPAAPVAPTCPVGHGPMMRMSSGTGWRCNQAGRWNATARRWSGCNQSVFDTPRSGQPATPHVHTTACSHAAPVAPMAAAASAEVAVAPARPAAPRTYRNDKDGSVVTTSLTPQEMLVRFAEIAPEGHWLWYHIAKVTAEVKKDAQDAIAFLSDAFLLAVGMGLKRPMIRGHFKDRRFKVYLSPRGSLCFKAGALVPGTHDPVGDEEYIGCLRGGRFLVARTGNWDTPAHLRRERKLLPVEQEFLDNLRADPAGFLAACGKDMDRCCYCNAALTDERSKKAGYGEVCASRWGLPWGLKDGQAIPTFASLWSSASPDDRTGIRGLCRAIRQDTAAAWDAQREAEEAARRNGQEMGSSTIREVDAVAALWAMLGDILEENGYVRRPEMPERDRTLPDAV